MKQRYPALLSLLDEVDYKTSNEIAEQLSVSNKTVQNLLKELDEFLQDGGAAVEVKHRTGFRLADLEEELYISQNTLSVCMKKVEELLEK